MRHDVKLSGDKDQVQSEHLTEQEIGYTQSAFHLKRNRVKWPGSIYLAGVMKTFRSHWIATESVTLLPFFVTQWIIIMYEKKDNPIVPFYVELNIKRQ